MIHRYKLDGFNIILDVASGSIHSVDDIAYEAIELYESGGPGLVLKKLRSKYKQLSADDITELIGDIESLIHDGKLFAKDTYNDAAAKTGAASVKALCLNVAHACNMRCAYCFAGNGEFSGLDSSIMPLETGKRAIDFLVENSGGHKTLDVDFFGGEPLLNWGVVKEIVFYARCLEKSTGKNFRFTLTTNGLLIDDDVISFTNEEMYNVVLSLDGRRETHDKHRKLAGQRAADECNIECNNASGNANGDSFGTYLTVVPKIKRLVEARGEKSYYIRGTFTRDNLDFTKDILHLHDLGFNELSMEPVVGNSDSGLGLTSDDIDAIYKQYELLAGEMRKRGKEGRGFTFYHYMINLTGGPCIHKRVAGCGVGKEYVAVTPQGELYPCHQFIGDDRFVLGDIWQGFIREELRQNFAKRGIYTNDECRKCWARFYCSGGCAANAFHASGSICGLHELGCKLFKKRIECAIMLKVAEALDKTAGS